MKINIDITLQVTDEELISLANVIDGKETKRTAKRVEVKQYVWAHGEGWQQDLQEDHDALFGTQDETPVEPEVDDLADLI